MFIWIYLFKCLTLWVFNVANWEITIKIIGKPVNHLFLWAIYIMAMLVITKCLKSPFPDVLWCLKATKPQLKHQDLGPESAPRARELCALKLAPGIPSWNMVCEWYVLVV